MRRSPRQVEMKSSVVCAPRWTAAMAIFAAIAASSRSTALSARIDPSEDSLEKLQDQRRTPLDPGSAGNDVDFVKDVQPIFVSSCMDCHNRAKRRGGLRLDSRRSVFSGGKSGPEIVPGKPDDSALMQRVLGLGSKKRMPLEEDPLSEGDIATLRAWIEQGARWPDGAGDDRDAKHWAYVAPVRPPLPRVRDEKWCTNAIDFFVLERLEHEGLAPSPEADRATLIRRVSLDLVGLPPSIREVEDFVRDPSPNAYPKVVERLLASPRYGERWARPWLDLARYADTNGYEKDLARSLWPWRDWVIRALNADMPFDEFTVKQLAGDLLQGATDDDRIATGFHRNTLLNDEGGADKEEFRVAAVVDRVNTTASVWLGTTMACCQCHDHKYDPFTQAEYYQLFAIFNQTEDSGAGNGPEIQVPSADDRKKQEELRAIIAGIEKDLDVDLDDAVQASWEQMLREELAHAPRIGGLQRHFALDALEGVAVLDSGPAPSNGKLTGGASGDDAKASDANARWVSGVHGHALHLDGGAFVDCGRAPAFERTDAFSYGAFVKLESGGCIIGKIDDPHGYRGFDLFANNGRLEVHIAHDWPSNGIKVETSATVAPGEWRHVFVTYDGSSKAAGVKIYFDGAAQGLHVVNDTLDGTIQSDVALKLGSREASGAFNGTLDDVRIYGRELGAGEVRRLGLERLKPSLELVPKARSDAQRKALREAFVADTPELSVKRDELTRRRDELAKLPIATTMVMKELATPRTTHVLKRGNFRDPVEEVSPDVPAVLHPFPKFLPHNRLTLAAWLVDPANPLVGRVTLNRCWEAFFGNGLVATAEDFGTQGDPPTHPELLDWLAVEFEARGWSMKAMHELIVTSSTYRQSSRVTPALLERDPQNRLYARGARMRLEAEMVRDNALAIAGLLSDKIGGPSVMPPQPDGIWDDSFAKFDTPNEKWMDAKGEDRWRRGLYTYLRRSAAYPSALVFDASRRDVCVLKRSRSNTPLQSLITLNDPVYVEAAAGLARRMMKECSGDASARIRHGVELCLARAPTQGELAQLAGLYQRSRERFAKDAEAAAKMAHQGEVEVEVGGLDVVELASWTVVANVLLNLDETITKG